MNEADIKYLQRLGGSRISEQAILHIIKSIGDDPDRPGLQDTPARVIRSWQELFRGYGTNVEALFQTFDDHEKYDGIVLCRDIEFMSTCEHHMLPFIGVGHVAYIPGEFVDKTGAAQHGHVIGLSKLARLLDAYSRRLQMQERIGQQVVASLMEHLQPYGAACILKAKHLCMMCRGVSKQHSEMVTSSVAGVFRDDPAARAELLSLITL